MLTTLSSLCLCRPLRTSLFFSTQNLLSTPISSSSTSLHIWSCTSSSSTQIQIAPATVEQNEEQSTGVPKVEILKQKLDLLGIVCDSSCVPGHYCNLLCPKCNGGQSLERSLSLYIVQKGDLARWRCFRTECNWADKVFLEGKAGHDEVKRKIEFQPFRQMTVEGLRLVPIGEEITAYFRERKISAETLWRNAVMQLSKEVQRSKEDVIAFTYRHKGLLVGCKYRTLKKRFWTERGSEKILYGIDDINDATEIIIVEGEIDKLSMEEAGFFNCVSAPGGGAGKDSPILPSIEKDTTFRYLWNCKQELDKVSRIILATDNDATGQALARALARRLGTNRCWQVSWPKKDESSCFKDANEVLKYMGPDALRRVIESAEPYELCISETVV
ncbi:PREDICTED: primase homolog protein [Fragaria vesca subsp. vesca]|uniref:primase homolog protein n=1 Tax=Fragaria vesca subsp. vesca TaxID=101020 RepID=UPI0002C2F487|nr:PREDICTED: primase homolog protein [Fragaria vesca subsp. vesca]XP_011460419.1 PREDICTED: primase homolog protein [Fragaria vesca subsp. vesca]